MGLVREPSSIVPPRIYEIVEERKFGPTHFPSKNLEFSLVREKKREGGEGSIDRCKKSKKSIGRIQTDFLNPRAMYMR